MAEPRRYDFDEKRLFSEGRRSDDDAATIQRMLTGCIRVEKVTTDISLQRAGIDYVATLRSRAEVFVDAKARDKGASQHWRGGDPDLSIEIWSVCRGTCPRRPEGVPGWAVDESKLSDLILFTFDPSDTDVCYLVGFQSLRIATREFFRVWSRDYRVARQRTGCRRCHSHDYQSEVVFVPASELLDAIKRVSIGQLAHSMFDIGGGE